MCRGGSGSSSITGTRLAGKRSQHVLRNDRRVTRVFTLTFVVFQCSVVAAIAMTTAEPPSGYGRPSSGGFGGGYSSGGYSSGGSGGGYSSGGYSSGGYPSGGGGYSSGGSYVPVAPGPSTYEGQYVDSQLLEQIKQIVLRDESQNSGSSGGYPSSSYGAPSSSYGAPSSSYGAPSSSYGVPSSSYGVPSQSYSSRVVGVELEQVKPAIQVAQYQQSSGSGGYSSGGFGGYSSGPSSSYGAPARPSSSYGVPSSSY